MRRRKASGINTLRSKVSESAIYNAYGKPFLYFHFDILLLERFVNMTTYNMQTIVYHLPS